MTISALSARLGPRKPSRPILVVDCLAIAAAVVLAHSPLGGVAHAMPDASQPMLGQAANEIKHQYLSAAKELAHRGVLQQLGAGRECDRES